MFQVALGDALACSIILRSTYVFQWTQTPELSQDIVVKWESGMNIL